MQVVIRANISLFFLYWKTQRTDRFVHQHKKTLAVAMGQYFWLFSRIVSYSRRNKKCLVTVVMSNRTNQRVVWISVQLLSGIIKGNVLKQKGYLLLKLTSTEKRCPRVVCWSRDDKLNWYLRLYMMLYLMAMPNTVVKACIIILPGKNTFLLDSMFPQYSWSFGV